jgi:hypothetical protein
MVLGVGGGAAGAGGEGTGLMVVVSCCYFHYLGVAVLHTWWCCLHLRFAFVSRFLSAFCICVVSGSPYLLYA